MQAQRGQPAQSPELEELNERIGKQRTEVHSANATAQSLLSRLDFWNRAGGDRLDTPNAAEAMARTLGERVSELTAELGPAASALDEARAELSRLTSRRDELLGEAERLWDVRVDLAGASDRVTLAATYRVDGCGWTPRYRLNALPAKDRLEMTYSAEVRQTTGTTWNAPLSLATRAGHVRREPPRLPQWIIRPDQDKEVRPMLKTAAPMAAMEQADASPAKRRLGTFAVWDLGKVRLEPGQPRVLDVRSMDLKAEYAYLARPALTEDCFLQADVRLEEAVEMPRGEAIFLVDGALLTQGAFSLAGREATIPFGTDPLVTARSTLLRKESGEKGLIRSDQTYVWKWRVKLANQRPGPAAIRLEEPRPTARDERIKLDIIADPEPDDRTENTLVWNLDLDAGQERTVEFGVELRAPEDMKLDLGWR
ncbi:DUF4139 domain-containing protein [Desulfohalovibrio reitneri]|uniref:DUF4139 domain-containing protein n=1 Tax=Desulfohalovibrio reitneri TaxID=1307759 RepID=UPI00110EC39F|nr:DUF4139 domain-containing protein [Desulfohalovibrio reitneri]